MNPRMETDNEWARRVLCQPLQVRNPRRKAWMDDIPHVPQEHYTAEELMRADEHYRADEYPRAGERRGCNGESCCG